MAWDFIKALLQPKAEMTPDFEQQKLFWNDAAKVEAKVREVVADELGVDIARVTP